MHIVVNLLDILISVKFPLKAQYDLDSRRLGKIKNQPEPAVEI